MSKAQDLLRQRKAVGLDNQGRILSVVNDAESLESYYGNIITDEDLEKALQEYGGNFEVVQREFIEKTRLQGADVGFLFFGVLLLVVKSVVLNKLTEPERANAKGGREDKIHEFQDKVLGKFSNGGSATIGNLNASLETIITTRGVPYDATGYSLENKLQGLKLFKGANHRFSTLGHDPALGLIFGTANILTSTLTTNKFTTYHVVYDGALKNPRIAAPAETITMLKAAADRFDGDLKSVVAAILKQLIHIATDLYTPCGIQLPGASLILDNKSVETLTSYISTGDVIKAGASAGVSVLINTIIAAVHGCKLIFNRNSSDDGEFDLDLYQARTRKIIMYSNIIASSSNIIATIVSKNVKHLDIGGLAVMLYRVFSDTRFICKLEYEFLNSGISDIYNAKYDDVRAVYGE